MQSILFDPSNLSKELNKELQSLNSKQKIEFGHDLVELAMNALSYPINIVISVPYEVELSKLSRKQLGRLGAGLIMIGVEESDWA